MRGAGGTSGGIGRFFIGFVMMCGGFFMLLNAIQVTSNFGFGVPLYGMPYGGGCSFGITTGMVMIPFIFGVGFVFYNARSPIGWVLAVGSLVALTFGVISSIQFTFRTMTAFDLIVILVLSAGGLGLFLNSLKDFSADDTRPGGRAKHRTNQRNRTDCPRAGNLRQRLRYRSQAAVGVPHGHPLDRCVRRRCLRQA